MDQIVEHKYYKGNPHPYDESLPSFAVISVTESAAGGGTPALACEFVTVAPNPKPADELEACGWRLLVEQISIKPDDTREGLFVRVKKLVEERVKIAYIVSSQASRDTMIFSAGHAFRLKNEITEEQFLQIVGRCAFEDPALIDGMLEKSTCEPFRALMNGVKPA